ncbi:MAG: TRCF domain-containing protein [Anaerovoracaceae bacterium]
MYKKIASVRSYDDEDEIIDELLDRFGDVPQPAVNLVKISHIRYLAELMSVAEIKQDKNKVTLNFSPENPLSGYALVNATEKFGPKLFIHGGKQPFIRLTIDERKTSRRPSACSPCSPTTEKPAPPHDKAMRRPPFCI